MRAGRGLGARLMAGRDIKFRGNFLYDHLFWFGGAKTLTNKIVSRPSIVFVNSLEVSIALIILSISLK